MADETTSRTDADEIEESQEAVESESIDQEVAESDSDDQEITDSKESESEDVDSEDAESVEDDAEKTPQIVKSTMLSMKRFRGQLTILMRSIRMALPLLMNLRMLLTKSSLHSIFRRFSSNYA
jgi:hypothetical protein